MEKLAVKLDSTHQPGGLKSWKHLSLDLGLSPRDIESLERPLILPSPSRQLFEYLTVTNPSITVRQLAEELQKINRHDAVAQLDRYISNSTGNCSH